MVYVSGNIIIALRNSSLLALRNISLKETLITIGKFYLIGANPENPENLLQT